MQPETLTPNEAAALLEVSRGTLMSRIRSGELPASQNPITGRWRIRRADLEALIEGAAR